MHFSKTYAQLLLTLPPELRENAIEYRQLKKLINQVVHELDTLGLSPAVLHGLLHTTNDNSTATTAGTVKQCAIDIKIEQKTPEIVCGVDSPGPCPPWTSPNAPKGVYEIVNNGDQVQPQLRLWIGATKPGESILQPHDSGHSSNASHVAIFLEKTESQPSSPVTNVSKTMHEVDESQQLMLVSKPIAKIPGQSLLWTLQRRPQSVKDKVPGDEMDDWHTESSDDLSDCDSITAPHPVGLITTNRRSFSESSTREIVIPLASDGAFFQLLQTALQSLAAHLLMVQRDFTNSLDELARAIAQSARPQSAVRSNFRPYSSTADPSALQTPLISPFGGGRSVKTSDLYVWREIFQLYVEAEVFEGMSERDRGERSVEDAEERLALFAERVTRRGFSESRELRSKEGRAALETFLQLNVLVLNLKKFQRANAEAARKILKKHTKRTALPFPVVASPISSLAVVPVALQQERTSAHAEILALIPSVGNSLPHILVQAIGETLLPIIPHIDDYECLICTSIAFKPIRLACGHLFCVRCLVKMQKRGKGNCPMCRATTVLQADRSNVDWALLNFMQDWFPIESKLKLKQNEQEAAEEQMKELGISDKGCIVS